MKVILILLLHLFFSHLAFGNSQMKVDFKYMFAEGNRLLEKGNSLHRENKRLMSELMKLLDLLTDKENKSFAEEGNRLLKKRNRLEKENSHLLAETNQMIKKLDRLPSESIATEESVRLLEKIKRTLKRRNDILAEAYSVGIRANQLTKYYIKIAKSRQERQSNTQMAKKDSMLQNGIL